MISRSLRPGWIPALKPASLLNTNLNVIANAGGVSTLGNVITLNIYLTEFNNNTPSGTNHFGNTMTTNNRSAGTTLKTAAWQDNDNGHLDNGSRSYVAGYP